MGVITNRKVHTYIKNQLYQFGTMVNDYRTTKWLIKKQQKQHFIKIAKNRGVYICNKTMKCDYNVATVN